MSEWSKDCPTIYGNFLMKCMENDYEPEEVRVFLRFGYKGLFCDPKDLYVMPVHDLHFNLCDVEWMKLA